MTTRTPCLLLVDDDATIRSTLARVLAEEGKEVALAATAEEALALLTEGLRPGFILLDLTMPGMNVADFMLQRAELSGARRIPVFVFSATRGAQDRVSSLGADGYVPKPVNLEDILELVERHSG